MKHRRPLRTGMRNGTIALAAILLSLLLVETGLRLAGISYPTFYHFEPNLGDALLPGAQGWYTKEGHAYIRVNSDGLRDREHAVIKPPNTLRIAILGDSYAEAKQVPVEKTFWSILGRELGACKYLGQRQVEVINFGVSGYGTAQELLVLEHKVWKYDPDIVLLSFVTANDVRNNSKQLQQGGRPYFVFRDGRLVLDRSFMEQPSSRFRVSQVGKWYYAILHGSRVAQLVHEFQSFLHIRAETNKLSELTNIEGDEPGLDSAVFAEPTEAAWVEAWNITENLLRMLHAEIKQHGARFLIVTLSRSIQVNPDIQVREHFKHALGVDDLLYPDRRIQALAREEGIEFLMLAPQLGKWAENNNECVHGFSNSTPCVGHWNEYGHKLGGELMASYICNDMLGANNY